MTDREYDKDGEVWRCSTEWKIAEKNRQRWRGIEMSRTGRKIALTLWFVNYYNTFVVGPNVQIIDVEYSFRCRCLHETMTESWKGVEAVFQQGV